MAKNLKKSTTTTTTTTTPLRPTKDELEKIYGPLHPGAVQAARNDYNKKQDNARALEKRRLAGVRRRAKITGRPYNEFGQGLGAHRRPSRKR